MTEQELAAAIAYIRENCTPTDVFTREKIIDWIAKNEDPTDVFPIRTLVMAVKYSKVEPV